MTQASETILDFDHSVGTEDRFAIRRFISDFIDSVNNQGREEVSVYFDKGVTAQGFNEFPLLGPQLVEMFYKKFFGRRHNYVSLPKVKLTSAKFLYNLSGNYEEYSDGILTTAGTIDIAILKSDDTYKIVNIKFYPRMRAVEQ